MIKKTISCLLTGFLFFSFASSVSASEYKASRYLSYPGIFFSDQLSLSKIKQKPQKINFEKLNSEKKDRVVVTSVSKTLIIESPVIITPTPEVESTESSDLTSISTTKVGAENLSISEGLNADVLFNLSNSYRVSKGLSIFQKDARVCSLAVARAPQIGLEIAEGRMHAGKNSHNFSYWFNENIISMRTEQEAFNWWVGDPIHHAAIVGDYTYSCVACKGDSCVQEFTNFQPK